MNIDNPIVTDGELRDIYSNFTKEQLIDALVNKHKECRVMYDKHSPKADLYFDITSHGMKPEPTGARVEPENNIPTHTCKYSKAMNQPSPRLCMICGKPEIVQDELDAYNEQLKNIKQLPQTQVSLLDQLTILRPFANRLGLYDAADYIRK